MSAQRFSIGRQFCWQGEFYEVRRLLSDQQVVIVHLKTEQPQFVTFLQLYQALLADELQFVREDTVTQRGNRAAYIDLSDCPEQLRRVAEYRLEVIRPLLDTPAPERHKAIQGRVEVLAKHPRDEAKTLQTAMSVASVYRWLHAYNRSGGDLRALIPRTEIRGGKQQSRLQADVEAMLQAVIRDFYYVRETKTIDFLYYEVAVRIKEENLRRPPIEQLAMPSRATVFRRLDGHDPADKLKAKLGKQAAKPQLSQYQATEYPTLPLARVEIDHTKLDLIVIDEKDRLPLGRLTLTYCLDTATRYPLGFYLGFEPPSYLAVMECLYHAMLPKGDVREQYNTAHAWLAYGIPYTLVIDNAKEFIGRDLDDACFALGIALERMPLQTPHFKATVERMFETINTGVLHGLPGTTFSNAAQRGDYQSLQQACISLSELEQILHLFLLDQYAEGFHRGLQDVPARRWEAVCAAGFFPRVPASANDLRILLGRVAYRTIQPYGIELFALRYQSAQLVSLRLRMQQRENQPVKVKYHPGDLSRIYVYDPDEKVYIEAPALAQAYTQRLSLWKHNVIRNFVLGERGAVDIAALGEAQRKIQAIVEQSLNRKKLRTAAKIARWQSSGNTPSASEPTNRLNRAGAENETSPSRSAPEVNLDLQAPDTQAWSVSYDLPNTQEE